MKLLRTRRPSVNTILGITKAKRRIKKASGYYAATRPLRWRTNAVRKLKRRTGYYSSPMKWARFFNRIFKKL